MTLKEAILKVLEENKGSYTYLEVFDLINKNNYFQWDSAKTPADTVSARLGGFIRKNDTRVKRVKGSKGYEYYFSKYENELNLSTVTNEVVKTKNVSKKYQERDLHILLSSYLRSKSVYSKTILHEKSSNNKDDHQKWIHPDMIGIQFLNLKNKHSNALLKIINKSDAFNLISYELKREIKTDYELKKCFFQAVSNSSWANYGYLVALEISKDLLDEIERLNQSFGIGVIELKSNPFQSEILFQPKFKELDYKTIDKLCEINPEFENFISQTEAILSASEKYLEVTRTEFERNCDDYFKKDSDVKKYCLEKHIPYEEDEEQ